MNQWAFLTPQRNVSGNDSKRRETERKEGRSSAAAGGVPTQSSDRAGQPGNLKPWKKSRQLSVTRPPLANLTTMVELDLRPLTPFTPTVSFCMRRFSFFTPKTVFSHDCRVGLSHSQVNHTLKRLKTPTEKKAALHRRSLCVITRFITTNT